MSIIATVHTLLAGHQHEQDRMNELGIKVGDSFTVTGMEIHNWHTNVYLEGYNDTFNSVFFNLYKNGTEVNIFEAAKEFE